MLYIIRRNNEKDPIFGLRVLSKFSRFAGMSPNDNHKYFYSFFQVFLLSCFVILFFFQIMFTYKVITNLEELCTSVILLITWIESLMKFSNLNWQRRRIQSIYASFEKCYYKYGDHVSKAKKVEIERINDEMHWFAHFYFYITLVTALTWILQMFARTLNDNSRALSGIEIPDFHWTFHVDTYFPFVIRYRWQYWLCVLFHWNNYFWLVIVFSTVDPTYLLMLQYLHGHLRILGKELTLAGECAKHSLRRNLFKCIDYHNELLRIAKEIEIICGLDILLLCFSFMFLVSFTGYLITVLDLFSAPIIKIIAYLIWCNIQIFMLTKAGHDIYEEMQSISKNAYANAWPDANKIDRLIVLLIIQRSNQSTPMRATRFIQITRETFSGLMNSAFSYITLLRNIDSV